MKILLTRIWNIFSQYVDNANHKSALEHHDEHGPIGPYSILCSLRTKDRQ